MVGQAVPAHGSRSAVTEAEEAEAPFRSLAAELRARYAEARPKSRDLYGRATSALPGGNSRSQLYFPPFPSYMVRGEGPCLVDVDGFRYVDLVNNYTALIHGHPSSELVEKLREQVAAGTAFGAPTPLEIELAEELCSRVPSVERVRFANSGTEACLYAIRTARAFTGRDDVIKVEGGYHGGSEFMQVSVKRLGAVGESMPEKGVPVHAAKGTHVIPFNDVAGVVDIVSRVGPRSAALIVEPMQGSAGAIPADPQYLRALRQSTREVGCLLVFDEVMTLRLSYGGAQELYRVDPDLTAMGKIIGGGFPVGAFGGRADVMEVLDPRREQAMGHQGTFNANPVTLAAGLFTMQHLTRERIDRINSQGDRIRDLVARVAERDGLPLTATGIGSIVQIHVGRQAPRSFRDTASRPKGPLECLFLLLLLEGVYIAPRGLLNLSTAIGEAEQEHVEGALERALEVLGQGALADAWAAWD